MSENILEVKDLTKRYPSFVLDKVSLKLPAGSIMGFIGRNGAGKTTTLKCISGLIKKDGGEIRMFGNDFSSNEKEDKSRLSFLLEGVGYYERVKIGKLTEVTKRFYPNWEQDKYLHYLQAFCLDENKSMKELSNGMKLKYQLAVALSHQAELFIFDEPTSGLDPVSRDEIQQIFKEIVKNGKRSILFSTHITSDLDKCADCVAYLVKGKIAMAKPKDEFISSFVFVRGNKELKDRPELVSSLISSRIEGEEFSGLGYKDRVKAEEGMEISTPDLEQIMVYFERSQQNEESII